MSFILLSWRLNYDRHVVVPSNITDDEALACGEFLYFWASYADTKAVFLVSIILNIHIAY